MPQGEDSRFCGYVSGLSLPPLEALLLCKCVFWQTPSSVHYMDLSTYRPDCDSGSLLCVQYPNMGSPVWMWEGRRSLSSRLPRRALSSLADQGTPPLRPSGTLTSHLTHLFPKRLPIVSSLTFAVSSLWVLPRMNVTVSTATARQGFTLSSLLSPSISWHKSVQIKTLLGTMQGT